MAKLVCQSGPNAGHEHALSKDRSTFGRQGDCDGQIPDPKASREHFCVQKYDNIWALIDLKSRNGTRLNGSKVSERILEFGDCISVGKCEYIFTKEEGDQSLGELLTKYDLDGRVGQGGMGIVYKARQRSMDRSVALKVLAPKFNSKPNFIDQFIREARAAGALNHPNIIQVHDVGTENGVHYFSMEYIDGPTCLHVLRNQGVLSPGQALEIGRQTAKALDYAHEHKLIHRDIKPDNIMLANGETVKLADLGISKTFDEIEQDNSKKIVGTPHYIAPEAAKGNKIDHRVDIYSLGATLYHLLSGQTPYQGSAPTDILKKLLKEDPKPLSEVNPDIPESVCEVVEKMMVKDPDKRYQTAMDLMKDMEKVQSSGDVEAKQSGDGETVILRRLAAGHKPGDAGGAETSYTTNHTSGDVSQHSHTTLSTGTRNFNPVQLILILIIVAALGVIGYTLATGGSLGENGTNPNDGTGTDTESLAPHNNDPANNGGNNDPTPPDNNDPVQPDNSAKLAREKAVTEKVDALAVKIRGVKQLNEGGALYKEITALNQDADIARNDKVRLQSLQGELDKIIKKLRTDAANAALRSLNTEVQGLINKHEYDTAAQRIAAVQRQHNSAGIKARFDSLRQDVTHQKNLYIGRIERRIKTATSNKDPDALRKLRNELPASFVDSDLAKKINKALRDIDNKSAAGRQVIITQAAKHLANWELTQMVNHYRENSMTLESSKTAHKQYTDMRDHAVKLQELVKKIDKGLKPRETYRGKIQHLVNPYVDGADENSLRIQLDSGGNVSMPWKDLDREVIENVIKLARIKVDDYKAALDAQEAAAELAGE